MTSDKLGRRMVPSYLATGGSAIPTRNTLQGLTALSATGVPLLPGHLPAHQRIVDLLGENSLTIAETAAYLDEPVGVCKVLAADLIDDGQLQAQGPSAAGPAQGTGYSHDREFLERVINGLRALK